MFQRIKDPNYRKLFISGQVKTGFPFQVRALRKARKMTQQELAELAETSQTVISRIERKGATNLSVQTLLKIAYAFDVALTVTLDPIDRFMKRVGELSSEAMAPRKSAEILADLERAAFKEATAASRPDDQPLRPKVVSILRGRQTLQGAAQGEKEGNSYEALVSDTSPNRRSVAS